MIGGYPYFRKHPYITSPLQCWEKRRQWENSTSLPKEWIGENSASKKKHWYTKIPVKFGHPYVKGAMKKTLNYSLPGFPSFFLAWGLVKVQLPTLLRRLWVHKPGTPNDLYFLETFFFFWKPPPPKQGRSSNQNSRGHERVAGVCVCIYIYFYIQKPSLDITLGHERVPGSWWFQTILTNMIVKLAHLCKDTMDKNEPQT